MIQCYDKSRANIVNAVLDVGTKAMIKLYIVGTVRNTLAHP